MNDNSALDSFFDFNSCFDVSLKFGQWFRFGPFYYLLSIVERNPEETIASTGKWGRSVYQLQIFECYSMTKRTKAYWKENLRYLFILLTIWFIVSFGAGILFKEELDAIKIGGFKLGFWFAQQGSMYVFVVLIFIYVRLMNKLDKKYGYDS